MDGRTAELGTADSVVPSLNAFSFFHWTSRVRTARLESVRYGRDPRPARPSARPPDDHVFRATAERGDGGIQEIGTHEELLRRNGAYTALHSGQAA
ncbi:MULTISPECIES: hypothetical protein [unclassified Streptomyces]|uniref:hypothetical protein n=1 Tax=Streptomyces sp. T21Q-yed TaxID=3018441 RepID=UPI0023663EC3|nr:MULTISPECIES: hypothetical protein [unclassified Streptomyces]WDF35435.1 hypothetical protein PBV52_00750 [Streptomyces sp. T12]